MKIKINSFLTKSSISLLLIFTSLPSIGAESDNANYNWQKPAIEQSFPTTREPSYGLQDHTVYRPADLNRFNENSLPVVVWANGACRDSNYGFVFISTLVATHGFIVVANGAFDAPAITGGSVQPQNLLNALDWLESDEAAIQFNNRADLSKIAVAGQSCGGLEALIAGADSRTKTVLAFNTGFFEACELGVCRSELENLHTPVLWVNGGNTDIAYENSIANFNLTDTPAYYAENKYAGHSGLLYGIREGVGDTLMLTQAEKIYVNWLDFMLNENHEAEAYFFGEDCDLCTNPDWVVMHKAWE